MRRPLTLTKYCGRKRIKYKKSVVSEVVPADFMENFINLPHLFTEQSAQLYLQASKCDLKPLFCIVEDF